MNFHLGIFNSAYMCYHNTVEVAQFFPNVSFTKTSLTKKEGKEEKKKGRQTGCQGTYGAEIATQRSLCLTMREGELHWPTPSRGGAK